MPWTLGMDLGREGAAVLLSAPDRAVAAVHWRQHVHVGRKCYRLHATSTAAGVAPLQLQGLPGGWALGSALVDYFGRWAMLAGQRVHVVAEDIYIGENPRTAVELAKFAGAIVSRVEHWSPGGEASWVKPAMWRLPLLGLPIRTKRDVAKAASLRGMPLRVQGLPELLAVLGKDNDHVTDAAGVAEWGARQPAR
jgi:hypothetical protein